MSDHRLIPWMLADSRLQSKATHAVGGQTNCYDDHLTRLFTRSSRRRQNESLASLSHEEWPILYRKLTSEETIRSRTDVASTSVFYPPRLDR